MAGAKVSALTALTGATLASNDLIPVVDVSDTTMAASGTTKRITAAELGYQVGATGILLGDVAAPATPTAGAWLYASSKAGRRLAATKGPSGLAQEYLPHFGEQSMTWIKPAGNGTTISTIGFTLTATGTATAANFATTNSLTLAKRISYISAATAGSGGGFREAIARYLRGSAAGQGGWHVICRFGFATIPATRRWFIGFNSGTGALANGDPSALTNIIGVGQDLADTQVQFMHNDGTGTAIKSTGSVALSSPAAGDVWEVRLFAAPNSSSISFSAQLIIPSAGGSPGSLSEYTYSAADLPAAATALAFHFWANNGTTATAIDPCLLSLTIENDY